ncbi:MAG TPA: hypothetical protein DIV86_03875 [Alphaproteobacteria bacterium]|nr:hypothetical protein [Alphaproteobacteria bacterium]
MRQAVIYISVPKELKGNYNNVLREQNTACLETALCYGLMIKGSIIDDKGKIYNTKRPRFYELIEYLERKKDRQYIILLKNLNILTPVESELEKILRLVRRRTKRVTFIEADEIDNHAELLKKLGLYFNQHSLMDIMEA